MKKLLSLFVVTLLSLPLLAQESDTVEMADALRANGKIYVVVAVLMVIFIGIVVYLVRIDRKLSRIEKETKK